MVALTNAKHERFAQELASGKTAEQSYITAGYKPSRANASHLQHKHNILARVSEILAEREAIHGQATAQAVKSSGLSKTWVIETLMENVARAMQATEVKDSKGHGTGEYQYQGNVANKALELLGKELGMFIDRKEVGKPGEFESMDADQLREFISREAKELGIGAAAPANSQHPSKLN